MADEKAKTLWVVSNRVDDRVVLFERDFMHPGGEAFVGGSGPAHVGRTPVVERLLREGMLLEIPEPPDGPKKPIAVDAGLNDVPTAQPGQVVRLGRPLDPDIVPVNKQPGVLERQADAPSEVPVPLGVEQPDPVERPTRERASR